jgi:hypothetical protein
VSAPRITLDDSLDAAQDWFYESGLTDGLPVIPPTPDRVARMLAATDREPDDELGTVPPRWGVATVETLAVNAVMAGCRPEYFPVVVTAVEAMLEEKFNLYAIQATTHPCAPLVIVNGPAAPALGINARYNVFGQGWRANATIGRAIRLVLLNVGGAAPGVLDRATHGQPSKFSFCIAENEEENPWQPLHVERGFRPEVSTVTVCGAESPHNLNDHISNDAAGILTMMASSIAAIGSNNAYLYGEPILCIGPEHAAILARDGYDKPKIREHLFRHARIPRDEWMSAGMYGMPGSGNTHFPDDPALPMFRKPEYLMIIVAGGAGRHSMWLPTFGAGTRSVTRAIAAKDGTPLRYPSSSDW